MYSEDHKGQKTCENEREQTFWINKAHSFIHAESCYPSSGYLTPQQRNIYFGDAHLHAQI